MMINRTTCIGFLICMLSGFGSARIDAAAESVPSRLKKVSQKPIDSIMDQSELGLSSINKPNGRIYRLRETLSGTHPVEVPRLWFEYELGIADVVDAGFLVLYRGTFAPNNQNTKAIAVMFDKEGTVQWELDLNQYLSRPDYLEIQDIRYSNGRLYFNEACLTYSNSAQGQCSALICVEPATEKVLWRTEPLISNNIFIIHKNRIFCGYGFTAEPDFLFILDAETGNVLSRTPVDSAHDYMEIQDDHLLVTTYKSYYQFKIDPSLFSLPTDAS